MENQVYHIQTLLADELDRYKEKGNIYAEEHIKEIQDVYKQEDQKVKQLITVNKGKQQENQVQGKEVFLYKSYNTSSKSSKPITPELIFIQDKVNNLDKHMKFLQSPVKTILFYPPPHYKSLQPKGEQNKQYWNKITVEFLKQKHNVDTIR